MGQHKHNPTAIAAKNGELPPKPPKMTKREKEILPPCKVGDIVYMVTPGGRIHEKKVLVSKSVVGSNLRDEIWVKHSFTCELALVFNEDDIGKTVFLNREEAERALKGE